jgi:hypothetical protein
MSDIKLRTKLDDSGSALGAYIERKDLKHPRSKYNVPRLFHLDSNPFYANL